MIDYVVRCNRRRGSTYTRGRQLRGHVMQVPDTHDKLKSHNITGLCLETQLSILSGCWTYDEGMQALRVTVTYKGLSKDVCVSLKDISQSRFDILLMTRSRVFVSLIRQCHTNVKNVRNYTNV